MDANSSSQRLRKNLHVHIKGRLLAELPWNVSKLYLICEVSLVSHTCSSQTSEHAGTSDFLIFKIDSFKGLWLKLCIAFARTVYVYWLTYSNSYTGVGGCHARCKPGESNQRPSDNSTLAVDGQPDAKNT